MDTLRLAVVSETDKIPSTVTKLLSSLGVASHVDQFPSLHALTLRPDRNPHDAVFIHEALVRQQADQVKLNSISNDVQAFIVHEGEAQRELLSEPEPAHLDHMFLPTLTAPALYRAIRYGIRVKCKERELQEMNQALLQSERRYRTLVENSIDGIELLDAEGRITFINETVVRKVLGVGPEMIIGRHGFDFVHDQDRQAVRDKFLQVLANPEQVFTLEYRVRHIDGSACWVEAVAVNRLNDPTIGAIVVNHRDISEKRAALSELKERNTQLEALFSSSPVPILSLGRDGRVRRWNPAAEKIFGWTEREVLDQFPPMIYECEKASFLASHSSLMAGNALRGKRVVLGKRDGSQVIAEVFGAPIMDAAANVTEVMAIVADVSERERAVEALRESEEKYRLLFERSLGGVFVAHVDGTLVDCNESFALSLGFEHARDVMGQNFLEFVTNDSAALKARLLQDEPILSHEMNIKRADGGTATLMANLTVAERRDNTLTLVQGSTIDITEHRALQTHMAQVQRMQEIGRLVGGISHDFNNIIMIMTSYSELVLDSVQPDDPIHSYVEQILAAADRGTSLVRQLLAFSRNQVLQPANLRLNDIVQDMAQMLPRFLGEDITIETHPSSDSTVVNVDRSQLEQILLNLAVNARDAMPTGGTLTLETSSIDLDLRYSRTHANMRPGRYVMLAVSDTGQGIDRKIQARIFEPFFTTKERGKGSGLGLATVYGIVKQSGGYIWVYSEVGKGTTFKIYFPQVDGPVEEQSRTVTSEQCSGNETVLFVEDEASVRRPACDYLSSQGYRVLEAGAGEEAVAIAEAEARIDAIVTDVVMPGMNGSETAQAILNRHPDARVLYISGYTDHVLSRHGVQPGGAFVQKPCTLAALGRRLRELLNSVSRTTPVDVDFGRAPNG